MKLKSRNRSQNILGVWSKKLTITSKTKQRLLHLLNAVCHGFWEAKRNFWVSKASLEPVELILWKCFYQLKELLEVGPMWLLLKAFSKQEALLEISFQTKIKITCSGSSFTSSKSKGKITGNDKRALILSIVIMLPTWHSNYKRSNFWCSFFEVNYYNQSSHT